MKSIKATVSSYFLLCGIWVILAFVNLILSINNPGKGLETGILIPGVVALLFGFWLRGFRIEISDGWLKYRDGYYRIFKIPIKDIKNTGNRWVEFNYLWRSIKMPRLVITALDGKTLLLINSKPFRRQDLNDIIRNIGI